MNETEHEVSFEVIDDDHVHIWTWDEAPAYLRDRLEKARFLFYIPLSMLDYPWAKLLKMTGDWGSDTPHLRREGSGAIVATTDLTL